jgi:hypothetical protein
MDGQRPAGDSSVASADRGFAPTIRNPDSFAGFIVSPPDADLLPTQAVLELMQCRRLRESRSHRRCYIQAIRNSGGPFALPTQALGFIELRLVYSDGAAAVLRCRAKSVVPFKTAANRSHPKPVIARAPGPAVGTDSAADKRDVLNASVLVFEGNPLRHAEFIGSPLAELLPLRICEPLATCWRQNDMDTGIFAARVQSGQLLELLDHLDGCEGGKR